MERNFIKETKSSVISLSVCFIYVTCAFRPIEINLPELSRATSQGALAQYVRVPADHLAIRPSNVTPVQAAGVTLAGQTAYGALLDCGKLEAGQTVLINGGSSAVGAFAIQIAKAKGAKVVATASGKNEAFVRRLGADEVSICDSSLPISLIINSL